MTDSELTLVTFLSKVKDSHSGLIRTEIQKGFVNMIALPDMLNAGMMDHEKKIREEKHGNEIYAMRIYDKNTDKVICEKIWKDWKND